MTSIYSCGDPEDDAYTRSHKWRVILVGLAITSAVAGLTLYMCM